MIAQQRIYVNADRSKAVPEDSPEAAILLAAPGQVIAEEDVRRLGLDRIPSMAADESTDGPEGDGESVATEGKAVVGPPEDKSIGSPREIKIGGGSAGAQAEGEGGSSSLDPDDSTPAGPGEVTDQAVYDADVASGAITPIASDDPAAVVNPDDPTPLIDTSTDDDQAPSTSGRSRRKKADEEAAE